MVKSESEQPEGLAVDIGTTNIKMCKVDLSNGKVLGEYQKKNSQECFGSDVMARISAACNGKAERMQELVRGDIELGKEKLDLPYPKKTAIVCNGVMAAILMGDPLEGMKEHPFSLHRKSFPVQDKTVLAPAASAFIGGDIIAGLSVLPETEKLFLFIDLGTNGEMVLGTREKMFATSVAAGPAFETYGEQNGSTKLELLAKAYSDGAVDETGLLREEYFTSGYYGLTQQEIRDIQMAKAAVRTGVEFLLSRYKACYAEDAADKVMNVYLAGGMGVLSEKACLTIGMLPKEFAGKICFLGNTALRGAVHLLLEETAYDDMLLQTRNIIPYPLAVWKEFNTAFVRYLDLPERDI